MRTGRISTDRNKRWRWKPVETSGRYKVTSLVVITLNLEFNSVCRKKKHSHIPLKCIDATRAHFYKSGRVARKTYWRFIGMWTRIEVYQILGKQRLTKFTFIERKSSQGICVVRGGDWQKCQATARLENFVSWQFGPKLEKQLGRKEKHEWAVEKTKAR